MRRFDNFSTRPQKRTDTKNRLFPLAQFSFAHPIPITPPTNPIPSHPILSPTTHRPTRHPSPGGAYAVRPRYPSRTHPNPAGTPPPPSGGAPRATQPRPSCRRRRRGGANKTPTSLRSSRSRARTGRGRSGGLRRHAFGSWEVPRIETNESAKLGGGGNGTMHRLTPHPHPPPKRLGGCTPVPPKNFAVRLTIDDHAWPKSMRRARLAGYVPHIFLRLHSPGSVR